jgi:outer membrane receptor protein involved in Fe transport
MRMWGKRGLVGSAIAAAALCSLLPIGPSAAAQAPDQQAANVPPTPAPQPSSVQEIVITGSRIPRPNLTASSPITVVNSQEVKLQGAVLTETLINSLPQAQPDQGAFLSNGATGTSTVNLRGFGPQRTLVLVNGRRLLPGDPGTPAPDINFIPSSLIKRVEVLTGGASSVYGSDAIAGVVNFILDTRLNGLRIDGQSSFYQHDNRDNAHVRPLLEASGFTFPTGNSVDADSQDINGAFGLSFARGRGHVTIYGGYRHLSGLSQDKRDYSACSVTATDAEAPLSCGGSPTSGPGTFVTQIGGRFRATADRRFVPPPALYNFAPANFYQRPGRRYTAGGFADFEVGPAFNPYAELMFMDDKTVAQVAPSGDFSNTRTINCDNPLLSAQQLALVCVDGNFVGQTPFVNDDGSVTILGSPRRFTDPVTGGTYLRGVLRIGRRNVEGGPRKEILTHRDWRWVVGTKGELGSGLSYDASYVSGRVKQRDVHTSDFLISRIGNAIDVITDPATGQPACRVAVTGEDPQCVPWDVFALGGVTQSALDYLTVPAFLAGSVSQQVATVSVTAELEQWGLRSPWAERGPALNIGAEYRKDRLIVDPDEHYQNVDLAGSNFPVLPLDGSTKVKELFGEARLPLVSHQLIEDLTIEAGYRRSWHENAGHRFSASSWKLAAELAPVRGIRFRASRQRAVRAPNIQELFAPVQQSGITFDPCAGAHPAASLEECQRTGVSAALYGRVVPNPFEDLEGDQSIVGGNPELLPERATTSALGVVLQPRFVPGLSATVDWFDIRLKGAIDLIGGDLIMETCLATGDPFFCSRIHRDSGGTLWATPEGFVDDRNANLGSYHESGIDIGASYTHRLGRLGSANLELNATRVQKATFDAGGLSPPLDCAGVYGQACGFPTPKWRHNLRATWQTPFSMSFSILWRHISAIPADSELAGELLGTVYHPASARIPAQDYFDGTVTYQVGDRYSLRFGVRNLFDHEPPIIPTGQAGACGAPFCNGNTLPQLYDPLGRFIFAGATIAFKP